MNLQGPIAIDLGELIGIAVMILFVVIPLIGRVLTKLREAANAQQRPRPAARRPPTDEVNAEIEAFLRRAGQRRQSRSGRPAGADEELRRRVPPSPAPSRPVERPVTAEVVEDAPVGSAIGRRVEKDLQRREMARGTARLGTDVVVADQQFDKHLQQTFSREVSRLAQKPGETAAAPAAPAPAATTPAAAPPLSVTPSLAAVLASPQSLCQAIILSEILQRRDWVSP